MAFFRPLVLQTRTYFPLFRRKATSPALPWALPLLPCEISRQVCSTFPLEKDSQLGAQSNPVKSSIITKSLSIVTVALIFATAGFVIGAIPAFQAANDILYPPTDEETLTLYVPEDDTSRQVEEYINNHPLTKELRSKPEFSESRPHLKIPPSQREHNFTGGTLLGSGRVVVPPFAWVEKNGKSLVVISYLGSHLSGHPGIVHGGFLATMLDEGMGRCCFSALPNKVGMTANLNVNYRAPVSADSFVVLRAWTTNVKGRKAWVNAQIETLTDQTEKPIVLVEASSLFIEPRQAAAMARVYPVSQ